MRYRVRMSTADFSGNIERFTGFADLYNDCRPSPPSQLARLLTDLAGGATPRLVVDLGCGTGLSTRYWSGQAERIIGVEPTAAMRAEAETVPTSGVSYQEGFSHATGLPDHCAQIVTAAQALHWMDPEGTFQEARRILVPGGVFAAYDYDWPPVTGVWEVDSAYEECMRAARLLEKEHAVDQQVRQWEKSGHLGRMKESGCFRYCREIVLHHIDQGDATRLLGLIQSQGYVNALQKRGLSDEQLGLDRLRETFARHLDTEPRSWTWGSRVRFGIV